MVAIIPAAGKGTRMAAITQGRPKELLEAGGKPIILYVLEEARAAGAARGIIVVSPDKPELISFALKRAEIAVQEVPTGHAAAVTVPDLDEPVLVLNPDTLFWPSSPSSRVAEAVLDGADIAIAVEQVSENSVSSYGIVELDEETQRISRILEKPKPEETSSRWAIAGRYAFSVRTYRELRLRVQSRQTANRELSLPPFLSELISEGYTGVVAPLESGENRFDCGVPGGYLKACRVIDANV